MTSQNPCFVGCDIGTSSAKAVVIDARGRVLGTGSEGYPLDVPAPGRAEQDAEDYWSATASSIRKALDAAHVPVAHIAGVALSSQAPVCIPLDEEGRPLRRAHIWMDRRADAECAWLRMAIGDDRAHELSGNVIDPYYNLPKILWTRYHEPDVYARAAVFVGAKDFVLKRLTGRVVTDPAHGALAGVAFDLRRRAWDPDVLQAIGLTPAKLPEIVEADTVIGYVTRQASRATGLPEGLPVAAGTVDLPAALLSLGLVSHGDQVLTLGSTACYAVVAHSASTVRGMITLPCPWRTGESQIVAGATVAAGGALRWFRDQFCAEGYEHLDELASTSRPGAHGLVFLPYLAGERTPLWDSTARGCLVGFTYAHGRGDLVRALLEGVAYSVRHNIEHAVAGGVRPTPPLWVTEGGARSELWRQILADVVGIPVAWIPSHYGGAPLGDAYLAAAATGHSPPTAGPTSAARTDPDPSHAAVYAELYRVYRALYPALRPVFGELVRVTAQPGA
jgi:sugar (pentulose or hexulose) kinase